MQSVYSIIRLAVGCLSLFAGVVLVAERDASGPNWWAVAVGGTGLTIALHELAFIHARFMKGQE